MHDSFHRGLLPRPLRELLQFQLYDSLPANLMGLLTIASQRSSDRLNLKVIGQATFPVDQSGLPGRTVRAVREKNRRMPFQVVEPQRLYQQVAEQLGGLIDRGEFREGDRLPPNANCRRSSASAVRWCAKR